MPYAVRAVHPRLRRITGEDRDIVRTDFAGVEKCKVKNFYCPDLKMHGVEFYNLTNEEAHLIRKHVTDNWPVNHVAWIITYAGLHEYDAGKEVAASDLMFGPGGEPQ